VVIVTPRPGRPTLTPTPTPTPEVATPSAEPIESTALAVGRSTDIRFKVEWPRALRAFAKNPLLGTGYSSIDLATDNDYLRILGEVGLLGGLAFLAVFLEISRMFIGLLAKKTASKEGNLIVLGAAGTAIGYFLNAVFIDVFESSKVAFFFWILMGIALKIIALENKKEIKNKN
jgi:O-antigen ligase